MAPHVSENLSRIRQSATELNKLADEATGHIRALDKFLNDFSPGIEVRDEDSFLDGREVNQNGHRTNASYVLGYGRDDEDGRFGLVVHADVCGTDRDGRPLLDEHGNPDESAHTAWVRHLDQASRTIRIAALARLPLFIEHLGNEMEKAVSTVKENTDKIRAASDELRKALLAASPFPLRARVDYRRGQEAKRSDFLANNLEDAVRRIKEIAPAADMLTPEQATQKYPDDADRYTKDADAVAFAFLDDEWIGTVAKNTGAPPVGEVAKPSATGKAARKKVHYLND